MTLQEWFLLSTSWNLNDHIYLQPFSRKGANAPADSANAPPLSFALGQDNYAPRSAAIRNSDGKEKQRNFVTIQPYLTRRLIILSFRAAARNLERLLMLPKPRIPRAARNDKVR